MVEIITVSELLTRRIEIPEYQRPYKWTVKNISELLCDIENAINNKNNVKDEYRYRLGTVILHDDSGIYKVVDGQQRIISLTLLILSLNKDADFDFLCRSRFSDPITKYNIKVNYDYIRDFLSARDDSYKKDMLECLESTLEVVVLTVKNEPEAFQLFDSQNTRGRALDPHDLLKAYHLREMKDHPYEMRHAVEKWEAVKPDRINNLFSRFLYPICNWSRKNKSVPFTADRIDIYKGIQSSSDYNYARRAAKASPYFQIGEAFTAGNDFFEMTAHYLELYNDVEDIIKYSDRFPVIKNILTDPPRRSVGFDYAAELFFCALLYYYDRFRNFDERVVTKLFVWAMMIRVDMQHLGFDTVNNYAIGGSNERYSNHIDMFTRIRYARTHYEISNLQINTAKSKDVEETKLHDSLIGLITGGVR